VHQKISTHVDGGADPGARSSIGVIGNFLPSCGDKSIPCIFPVFDQLVSAFRSDQSLLVINNFKLCSEFHSVKTIAWADFNFQVFV
jgi:hypothetical protein